MQLIIKTSGLFSSPPRLHSFHVDITLKPVNMAVHSLTAGYWYINSNIAEFFFLQYKAWTVFFNSDTGQFSGMLVISQIMTTVT